MNDSVSVQQLVGLNELVSIPWGHHVLILEKLKLKKKLFYVNETLKNNWSRSILAIQLKQSLFDRQGKAINNFDKTLQVNQAQIANQLLKILIILIF